MPINDDPKNSVGEYEIAVQEDQHYVLQLYVTGATERSMRAIAALKTICSEELQGRCEIEVIDVYQHPELVREEQIVVLPTLIKKLPIAHPPADRRPFGQGKGLEGSGHITKPTK
jgi:circadian clock protein KaiB